MSDTVYRVQDARGRGPFQPGFSHRWSIERGDHDNLHPWFTEFGRIDLSVLSGMTAGSACRTLDQLRRWFTEDEFKKLRGFGFAAFKMEATVLAESEIQLFVQRPKRFTEDIEEIELYPLPQ